MLEQCRGVGVFQESPLMQDAAIGGRIASDVDELAVLGNAEVPQPRHRLILERCRTHCLFGSLTLLDTRVEITRGIPKAHALDLRSSVFGACAVAEACGFCEFAP